MGCGIGLLGRSISDKVGKDVDYLGIDLSISSVQEEYKRGIIGVNADISNLPLQSDTFDKIVTTDVLEHVEDSKVVVEEMFRVLKPGGKAFVVIADPSEGRFSNVADHINRSGTKSDVKYWEKLFSESGFKLNFEESKKYRNRDWRSIFKLPILAKLKDKPGFACAFNPVYRPGVYILEKP
jgi:ubiquinone/menaquinone biosynthesis C-methylase UbiE